MEILLSIVYSLIFIWLIFKLSFFDADGLSRKLFAAIFILKIICGIMLWVIYTYFYSDRPTADIYKYFDDSKFIYDALSAAPLDYLRMVFGIANNTPHFDMYYQHMNHWHREFERGFYNEYQTLIRLNAILRIFSQGYFNVHTVFMSFLSLIGLTGIYKTFVPFLQNKKKELMMAIFFIPSVLFWGSGVLKEGFLLFVFGMLIFIFYKIINQKFSIPLFLSFIVFLVLLLFTKLYLFLVLIPALIAYWLVNNLNNKLIDIKYIFVLAIYAFLGLNMKYIFPKYDLLEIISEKQHGLINQANGGAWLMHENKFVYIDSKIENRITRIGNTGYGKINLGISYKYYYRENSKDTFFVNTSTDTTTYWIFYDQPEAGSKINIGYLEPNIGSFFINTPQAILNSLFRPHVFEAKSPLLLVQAIENFFLLVFILVCLLFSSKNIQHRNVIYFCFTISILLLILTGLATPIMGAIVRYRVPVLPFLLIAFLLILDKQKLLSRFPSLKKLIAE